MSCIGQDQFGPRVFQLKAVQSTNRGLWTSYEAVYITKQAYMVHSARLSTMWAQCVCTSSPDMSHGRVFHKTCSLVGSRFKGTENIFDKRICHYFVTILVFSLFNRYFIVSCIL